MDLNPQQIQSLQNGGVSAESIAWLQSQDKNSFNSSDVPGDLNNYVLTFGNRSSSFDDFLTGRTQAEIQGNINSALQEQNQQWEEHMRDTSISSAFQQYKDVGVSPYLAVMQGSQGVTAQGGSAASVSQPSNLGLKVVGATALVVSAVAKILKALK